MAHAVVYRISSKYGKEKWESKQREWNIEREGAKETFEDSDAGTRTTPNRNNIDRAKDIQGMT